MVPQREASSPRPPLLLVPRKIGGAFRPLSFSATCIPTALSPPTPPLAPSVLAPRAWALGSVRPTARCPPRRPGGLIITSVYIIAHIYCVSVPIRGRLFFLCEVYRLPTSHASLWLAGRRTPSQRFCGYAYHKSNS